MSCDHADIAGIEAHPLKMGSQTFEVLCCARCGLRVPLLGDVAILVSPRPGMKIDQIPTVDEARQS